jgi:quinol monooxygenase YgiN
MPDMRSLSQTGIRSITGVKGDQGMFGLISKMTSVPRRRDELEQILARVSVGMPGCHSYTVAADMANVHTLWVTEIWDSEARHRDSLSLPAVQEAIAQRRDLVVAMDRIATTTPIA